MDRDIVRNVQAGAQEIQKHVPRPNKLCLVNAGEGTGQVLLDEDAVSINRGFFQDG